MPPPLFRGGGGTSAAKSVAEPPMEVKNEPQITDQTTTLDDLNVEDWPLEYRFKVVSDFLDSMPCSPRATKPKRDIVKKVYLQCTFGEI